MLKDVVGYLRNTIALPLRYTRKPSRVSMLFAELASGDAALAKFHSHNFVEGAPKNVRLCNIHPGPLVTLTVATHRRTKRTVVRSQGAAIITLVT